MAGALKLVVFGITRLGRKPAGPGLRWRLGPTLYRGLGGADGSFGAWLTTKIPGSRLGAGTDSQPA